MFQKFAKLEVLDVKGAATRLHSASLTKFADYEDYRTDDGYVYVRVRAISSRVNKNHDGWPSEELKKSYRTFIGKPIFVDHHNSDPKRARGVIVDAALHIEDTKTSALDPYYSSAPENHLPPTWIELLLEVDAKRFPKLAKAIIDGDIDGVSMGANVEISKCSHCGNEARSPEEYCKHVQSKGAYFDFVDSAGHKTSKKSYEDCYDVGFFEISFVFDPADETALVSDIKHTARQERIAAIRAEGGAGAWDTGAQPQGLGEPTMGYGDDFEQSPEEDRVNNWRVEQFIRLGYPPDEAVQLAASGQDYHDFENMMGRGATPDQAQRIIANVGPQAAQAYKQLRLQGIPTEQAIQQIAQQFYGGDIAAASADIGRNVQLTGKTANQYIEQRGDKWVITQKGTGKVLSEHDSEEKANASFRAMEMHKHEGHVKTADQPARQNPIPQSEMTTAPDKVNTLRQEQVCPICGSTLEDGVCEVCNYEEPPEGFDNPDLSKAKEVDKQMHQQDAEQAAQGQTNAPSDVTPGPSGGPQPLPGGAMPGQPGPIVSSTGNTRSSDTVSSDKTKTSATSGGRVNTQERPILPVTRKLTDKPNAKKTISEAKKPVLSTNKENMTQTQKTADGATALGEGVQAEKRVDVEGVGAVSGDPLSGIEHENVEKDTGDFTAPHTDTWSDGEGDSLGQHDPVTSEPFEGAPGRGDAASGALESPPVSSYQVVAVEGTSPAGDDAGGGGSAKDGGPTWDSSDAGFPDHQPARVDLLAPLKEEVGAGTTTDPGEEFRSLKHGDPVTKGENANSLGGPIGVAVAKAKAIQLKAFKVAETEIELGIESAENKYVRVAALEDSSEEALDATLEALAKVKTSGLRKQTSTTKTGATRMPSLRPVTASFDIEAHSVGDPEIEDALW